MMEVAAYGGLTGIWWIASVTFLLPILLLLKSSKSFRDRWFAFVYQLGFKLICDSQILPQRKKVFELLKEKLSRRNLSNVLKVLEIGVGPGDNLQFYPENCHLTALDMNVNFASQFLHNQKKNPQIVLEKKVTAFAEDMKDISDNSMDVVISTYVLCSVNSVKDVLREVKRVLKPGGKFLFLEHVNFPKSSWPFTIQQLVDPLWNIYFDGCSLVKNSEYEIKNAGFSDVICDKIIPDSVMLFIRFQIYGIATK